jgi:hypothetical protein
MARFTTQNAREMAARSHEARRRRLANLAEGFSPQSPQIGTYEADDDAYVATRLGRVRRIIAKLDRAIERETNKPRPGEQQLNWLVTAQALLSKQERQLADDWREAAVRRQYDFGIN